MNRSVPTTVLNTDATLPMQRAPRNELELLEREGKLAERGLVGAIEDIGRDITHAVDPRQRMNEHPLVTLAVAVGGGFFGAKLVRLLKRQPGLGAGAFKVLDTSASALLRSSSLRSAFKLVSQALTDSRHTIRPSTVHSTLKNKTPAPQSR
jgi:hypothetical protein